MWSSSPVALQLYARTQIEELLASYNECKDTEAKVVQLCPTRLLSDKNTTYKLISIDANMSNEGI
jgi:hypothetical protein